jgi:hypothetical protein
MTTKVTKKTTKKATNSNKTKTSNSPKTSSSISKKVDLKKPPKKPSITSVLYDYFDKFEDLSTLELDKCVQLAKSVKKDSRFDKNHLAWHKNKYTILAYNNLRPNSKLKL